MDRKPLSVVRLSGMSVLQGFLPNKQTIPVFWTKVSVCCSEVSIAKIARS